MAMPTQAEIDFAHYGHELQNLIHGEMHQWMAKFHASGGCFRELGQEFDQHGSKRPSGHTLEGQVKVDYFRFVSPKTKELEAIEISMGHDADWKPVVSVSSSTTDPVAIKTNGVAIDDYFLIREQALRCFESAGVNWP